MINKSRLTVLLVRTALFFVAAVVLGIIYDWPSFSVIAAVLTGAAALVQLGGVLWLRRTERNAPESAKEPVRPDGFL
ncbi:hypothetical protein [Saccharopolyspora spinosa]|uniref:Uncharacterized protein n=1 Tax=Saccharopolyspora spinosa TaxID=60894 RepID=A0A2N3Y7I2_SACSN|nr:hypothetical protein [Saccharopolyspora spinosa]PKW18838.1 hypothetical protein A8926_6971 [Saccharopolyspora spinosa]